MRGRAAVARVIDCDVHCAVPGVETLFPYLDDHWRSYVRTSAFKGAGDSSYPRGAPTSLGPGAEPPTNLDVVRRVLDRSGAELAVLNCEYGVQFLHNPDLAAAMAGAVNDWLIAEWLEKEPRLRASLVTPLRVTELAVREVERVGGHPGFVQLFLPVLSETPYGHRRYWPLYEAALRHDLAIAVQPGAAAGNLTTPTGWPTYYVEEYVGTAQVFQTQVVSLVAEGVFDTFPDLRAVMVESGWTWLPSLMWRLDKDWRSVRREVPWVRRPPSEYVREHVRFTLQPVDAPPEPRWLLEIVEQTGSDELIMFSSDYPHDHGGGLPPDPPPQLGPRILDRNARAFYRF